MDAYTNAVICPSSLGGKEQTSVSDVGWVSSHVLVMIGFAGVGLPLGDGL